MSKPHPFLAMIGLQAHKTGHLEKLLAAAGGLLGILAMAWVSRRVVGSADAAFVVASMGASAVLLFAVPHGPLSQPWPVFGGHMLSALVGVGCAHLIADPLIASAVAVSLAILLMQYMRCIHPPGGATAMTAVMGGEGIEALGFMYLLTPVLLNVLIILVMAVLLNYPFPWRRYPTALARAAGETGGGK